jgi:hypothetical protein
VGTASLLIGQYTDMTSYTEPICSELAGNFCKISFDLPTFIHELDILRNGSASSNNKQKIC